MISKRFDYSRVGRYKLKPTPWLRCCKHNREPCVPDERSITIIREIIRLNNSQESADDIDALNNRRVKPRWRTGCPPFRGYAPYAAQRHGSHDYERHRKCTWPGLMLALVVAAVRGIFAGSQLSQLLTTQNPAELAHKRRLSSMGPVV